MREFTLHSEMTAPGRHAAAIRTLPGDVASLLATVQGLFVHGDALAIYGLEQAACDAAWRGTLPVEERLDAMSETCRQSPFSPRPVSNRAVVTCRDYAVMLCALLREKAIPARVRCGFAGYLSPGRHEDHWICEYWNPADRRWARADAQLDDRHRAQLSIDFDPADLPEGAFLTAKTAWQLVRLGHVDASVFGHGQAVGEWFLRVNLVRDCLALLGTERSPWDTWRQAPTESRQLDEPGRRICDDIANAIERLEQGRPIEPEALTLQPFWTSRDE